MSGDPFKTTWDGRPPGDAAGVDGWHWLRSPDGEVKPYRWDAAGRDAVGPYGEMWWGTKWSHPKLLAADGWRYVALCPMPKEASANVR